MNIEPVSCDDVSDLLNIAKAAVLETVDAIENDKPNILDGILNNIMEWHSNDNCVFYKFTNNGITKGFILIKEYWNFSDIFVLPKYQRQGIGRCLAEHAIEVCKEQEMINIIRVNASKNAEKFYRSLGFKKSIINKVLPYKMVPYEYHF